MVLRKITTNNSVRYVPISEKAKEKECKPKTIKSCSLSCEKNKNISQNSKKPFKNVAAGGLATL